MTILTIQALVAIACSFFGLWCYFEMIRTLRNESERRSQQIDDLCATMRQSDKEVRAKWDALFDYTKTKEPYQ